MLESLLIGLDGSQHAKSAMELGLRWAKKFNAFLGGIGIVDVPELCSAEMMPVGGAYYKKHRDQKRVKRAWEQVTHFLEEFAQTCLKAGVAARLLGKEGLPHERILLEAQPYDLVLLGQQTHFQPREALEDTTLHFVLKGSPCPVVTVPEHLSESESVLIAYDGSLQAARALRAFESSGIGQSQSVHLVTTSSDKQEAVRHVEWGAEFLRRHQLAVTTHPIVSSKSPAAVILEQAENLKVGMIVMGAYGRSAIYEFFLGSVTKTVLQEAQVPLFLYH